VRRAAAALLLLAACTAGAQGVDSQTVALGQSAPLSGASQALGEDIRNGALAYFRTLNETGGVHGRRIELATLDDAGDAKRALANTQRMAAQLRVFALLAYPEPSVSRELLTYVQQARIPFFAPVTGAEMVRLPQRTVVTVRASHAEELDQVVEHYARLGLHRFALATGDEGADAEFREAFARVLKKRSLAPAANRGDADVILVVAAQRPAADLVAKLKRARFAAQIVVLSLAEAAPLARALGRDGAGVTLSLVVPPLERISLPLVAEYRAALEAETGRKAYSAVSLESFIGAKVFAEAVRRAGPSLTRETLMQALDSMSAYDAGGYLLSFGRGDRHGSSQVELVAIGRDGNLLH
jgi:ABC-type branched-subunit amino acid transport system substrate-binding protein